VHSSFTDQYAVRGGIEFGATFASVSEASALAEVADHRGAIMELVPGFYRGAPVGWISQYPSHRQVLLPPVTFLEVQGTRVKEGCLFVDVRCLYNEGPIEEWRAAVATFEAAPDEMAGSKAEPEGK